MGRYIKNPKVTKSFEDFDTFSKGLDAFFSLHIAETMRKKFPHTYTVFGGGDDLFIVGAWDEVLALAREVHDRFANYVKHNLSISFSIALAKPSTPIAFMAEHTEELLEEAKAIDEEKDALSMFGETVKWKRYLTCFKELMPQLEKAEEHLELKTAWLYRILELIEMRKQMKTDPTKSIWKSKLAYTISRNIRDANDTFRSVLDRMIESYPEESKLVLTEFIYKRRKA
jgi:CRISPR-associated protein Csm1